MTRENEQERRQQATLAQRVQLPRRRCLLLGSVDVHGVYMHTYVMSSMLASQLRRLWPNRCTNLMVASMATAFSAWLSDGIAKERRRTCSRRHSNKQRPPRVQHTCRFSSSSAYRREETAFTAFIVDDPGRNGDDKGELFRRNSVGQLLSRLLTFLPLPKSTALKTPSVSFLYIFPPF